MTQKLLELYHIMTPQEKAEFEAFAVFVIARRKIRKQQLLTDDISIQELTKLIEQAGSFDWLKPDTEDVYSIDDGEAVEWSNET